MVDGAKIWAQREATEKWLDGQFLWSQFFEKSSEHPSWQGKVKCKYCKRTGWPQYEGDSGNRNPKWWGHKHGRDCKWKELYDLKMRSQQATPYIQATNWPGNSSWGNNWGTIITTSSNTFTYHV